MSAKKTLSSEAKKVLKTVAKGKNPLANKEIAALSGLEAKTVSSLVKELKSQGFLDSPARCKYGITPAGKGLLGK